MQHDLESRYRSWRFFQVLLPFVLLLLVSLHRILGEGALSQQRILKVLSGCDMLLLAALILIGVAAEFGRVASLPGKGIQGKQSASDAAKNDFDGILQDFIYACFFFGIVFLVLYAMVQADASAFAAELASNEGAINPGQVHAVKGSLCSPREVFYAISSLPACLVGVLLARACYLCALRAANIEVGRIRPLAAIFSRSLWSR